MYPVFYGLAHARQNLKGFSLCFDRSRGNNAFWCLWPIRYETEDAEHTFYCMRWMTKRQTLGQLILQKCYRKCYKARKSEARLQSSFRRFFEVRKQRISWVKMKHYEREVNVTARMKEYREPTIWQKMKEWQKTIRPRHGKEFNGIAMDHNLKL